jgi:hypothetical protein
MGLQHYGEHSISYIVGIFVHLLSHGVNYQLGAGPGPAREHDWRRPGPAHGSQSAIMNNRCMRQGYGATIDG